VTTSALGARRRGGRRLDPPPGRGRGAGAALGARVLLVETSAAQAALTAAAVSASGLSARVVHDDELTATVVLGTRVR
jgi:hypothetical protein